MDGSASSHAWASSSVRNPYPHAQPPYALQQQHMQQQHQGYHHEAHWDQRPSFEPDGSSRTPAHHLTQSTPTRGVQRQPLPPRQPFVADDSRSLFSLSPTSMGSGGGGGTFAYPPSVASSVGSLGSVMHSPHLGSSSYYFGGAGTASLHTSGGGLSDGKNLSSALSSLSLGQQSKEPAIGSQRTSASRIGGDDEDAEDDEMLSQFTGQALFSAIAQEEGWPLQEQQKQQFGIMQGSGGRTAAQVSPFQPSKSQMPSKESMGLEGLVSHHTQKAQRPSFDLRNRISANPQVAAPSLYPGSQIAGANLVDVAKPPEHNQPTMTVQHESPRKSSSAPLSPSLAPSTTRQAHSPISASSSSSSSGTNDQRLGAARHGQIGVETAPPHFALDGYNSQLQTVLFPSGPGSWEQQRSGGDTNFSVAAQSAAQPRQVSQQSGQQHSPSQQALLIGDSSDVVASQTGGSWRGSSGTAAVPGPKRDADASFTPGTARQQSSAPSPKFLPRSSAAGKPPPAPQAQKSAAAPYYQSELTDEPLPYVSPGIWTRRSRGSDASADSMGRAESDDRRRSSSASRSGSIGMQAESENDSASSNVCDDARSSLSEPYFAPSDSSRQSVLYRAGVEDALPSERFGDMWTHMYPQQQQQQYQAFAQPQSQSASMMELQQQLFLQQHQQQQGVQMQLPQHTPTTLSLQQQQQQEQQTYAPFFPSPPLHQPAMYGHPAGPNLGSGMMFGGPSTAAMPFQVGMSPPRFSQAPEHRFEHPYQQQQQQPQYHPLRYAGGVSPPHYTQGDHRTAAQPAHGRQQSLSPSKPTSASRQVHLAQQGSPQQAGRPNAVNQKDSVTLPPRWHGKGGVENRQSTGYGPQVQDKVSLLTSLAAALRELESSNGDDPDLLETVGTDFLDKMPADSKWRVLLEVGLAAKRLNFDDASRKWLRLASDSQPTDPTIWLERVKLEEECGMMGDCLLLILEALTFCPDNEALLIKGVRVSEQIQHLEVARYILSRLQFTSTDRMWRVWAEGAHMEARAGKISMAQRILEYLLTSVPSTGPLLNEAVVFAEKQEHYDKALRMCQEGLTTMPKYAALWFTKMRLLEKMGADGVENLQEIRRVVSDASQSISKELIWKLYFEAAQIEERMGCFEESRVAYLRSLEMCPPTMRWKVWLAGARLEARSGQVEAARELLDRGLVDAPKKAKAVVFIEWSRLCEYLGEAATATEMLERGKLESENEWKIYLESIMLALRAGNSRKALDLTNDALKTHVSTGRLWALLIQLSHEDVEAQWKEFKRALQEVPKSGEVWCEGARIRMNPLSPRFNLRAASRYLEFAVKFTPQYGDSFIELMRLVILSRGDAERLRLVEQMCVNADPNYGPLWFFCKTSAVESVQNVLRNARQILMSDIVCNRDVYNKAIEKSSQHEDFRQFNSWLSPEMWRIDEMDAIHADAHEVDSEEWEDDAEESRDSFQNFSPTFGDGDSSCELSPPTSLPGSPVAVHEQLDDTYKGDVAHGMANPTEGHFLVEDSKDLPQPGRCESPCGMEQRSTSRSQARHPRTGGTGSLTAPPPAPSPYSSAESVSSSSSSGISTASCVTSSASSPTASPGGSHSLAHAGDEKHKTQRMSSAHSVLWEQLHVKDFDKACREPPSFGDFMMTVRALSYAYMHSSKLSRAYRFKLIYGFDQIVP